MLHGAGRLIGTAWVSILSRLRPRQHPEPIAGAHSHQPVAPVALVDDDRDFLAGVVNGLGHRIVDIKTLDGLHFKVKARQVRANYVWAIRRARKLLTAPCIISMGSEFVAPGALTSFAFLARVHRITAGVAPKSMPQPQPDSGRRNIDRFLARQ